MPSGWTPQGVEARDPSLVELGDGLAVPREFAVDFAEGRRVLRVHVRIVGSDGGQPDAELTRVEMGRADGRSLRLSDPQRVPWGALFDEAVAAGARFGFARTEPDGAYVAFADPGEVEQAVRRLRRREGRRLTAQHLALVREVADANPHRPEAAVVEAWGVKRTTAAYWLRRAREQAEENAGGGS